MLSGGYSPIEVGGKVKQGPGGNDGVGISKIEQKGLDLVITMTNNEVFTFKIPKPKDGTDGVAPTLIEITKNVLSQIRQPEDGVSPAIEDIVDKVLKQIKIPEPVPGEPGKSPTLEEVEKQLLDNGLVEIIKSKIPSPKIDYPYVIQAVLEKVVLPTVIHGADGVAPTLEEVIEALKAEGLPKQGEQGEPGKPGLNAPFSTWTKFIEAEGVTNPGSPSVILRTINLKPGTVNEFVVSVIAKGPNNIYFVGSKSATVTSVSETDAYKPKQDVVVYEPRKSDMALDFGIQVSQGKVEITASGLTQKELEWKAEIQHRSF